MSETRSISVFCKGGLCWGGIGYFIYLILRIWLAYFPQKYFRRAARVICFPASSEVPRGVNPVIGDRINAPVCPSY
jgi:hypothetical protein